MTARHHRLGAQLCAALCLVTAQAVLAAPTFVNGITLSGAAGDRFGTGANDGRLGYFSDLYYDPAAREWWGLSDRGPGGGTLSYETRVQRFTLDVDPATGAISNFKVVDTVKFRDGAAAFNGLAPSPSDKLGRSFDPEGFVVNPRTGRFLVSDEYGPSVYEFDRSGQFVRAFKTPENLVPRNAATGVPNYAGDAGNTAGKRSNRGFEGLAISPDGRYAYAMLQSPMLDEGGTGAGLFTRIVKFDTATGEAVAQYAYRLDRSGQGQGISALVAINDTTFLVLERNNRGVGVGATLATADKSVYLIDISGAEDVSGLALPASGSSLPAGFDPVAKGVKFLDLDANTLKELGFKSPEKWEGLAIGPSLLDGGYLMLAGTDNDYSVTQNPGSGEQFDVYFRFTDADPYASSIQCPLDTTTGCFFTADPTLSAVLSGEYSLLPGVLQAYRVSAADLPGYVRPVGEPAALGLVVAGLLGARWMRRRRALS
ncbi:MAG TPA: esterase-like activity of phytase family protein [Burkholderiaceae bacterium]|nr:esterase-like activity of phytase family protein [Burkholderiaceae bacterium]